MVHGCRVRFAAFFGRFARRFLRAARRIADREDVVRPGPSASRSPRAHCAFELLEQSVAGDLQLGRPIDPGAKVVGNGRHGNGVDAEASSSAPPLAETHA